MDGDTDLYVATATGGDVQRLTSMGGVGGVQWSPDGSMITFSSGNTPSGQAQLFVISPSGGEPQALTSEGYNAGGVWSPDGSKILYSSLCKLWIRFPAKLLFHRNLRITGMLFPAV